MRPLDLDFRAARPASPWAGRLLLVLAVAFVADAGLTYQRHSQALGEAQARLARLEPGAARPSALVRTAVAAPEEIAIARETVERLSLPWDKLFSAIEAAASDRVTLLGIEPNPRAGTVLITGEGKDYLAALGYVLNLSRIDTLRAVHLVRHEQRERDPQRAVAFAVSATWKEAK
jgi:hypothetical protein